MKAAPSAMRNAANFVAFQVVWLIVVWSAADRVATIGLLVAIGYCAVHLWFSPRRTRELRVVLTVTLLGLAVDQLSVAAGVQVFDPAVLHIGLVPAWIAGLWLAFATTLSGSLRWMQHRLAMAALARAVLGPIAYVAAENLGALTIGRSSRGLSLVALAVEWALMMPLALLIARDPAATSASVGATRAN